MSVFVNVLATASDSYYFHLVENMRKYAGILLSSVYKTYVGPLIDSTKCATKGSVLSRNRTKTISPRDVFARGIRNGRSR